ncbi:MAG: phospholipid carrier-dependent glycosyltransferase [Alkalinema sp. RU_4_3]|nr:phospholipid carrier-dependent glycosyltransferase [Alkalinema sp. RU_4_3]
MRSACGLAIVCPLVPDVSNTLTGSLHKTWSYRWLNALTGSFIPLVAAALVYQLTQRWRITLLTAGLLSAGWAAAGGVALCVE